VGAQIRIEDLVDRITNLESRLKIQETTSRLQTSSLQDGTLTLQDANGLAVVTLGKQADGTHGIQVANVNGRTLFQVTSENGQTAPYDTLAAQSSVNALLSGSAAQGFRPGTNAGAFTELWRTDFYSNGAQVDYDLTAYANGGNMSWQIVAYEYGGGTPVAVASGTETTNVQRQGTFTISSASLVPGTGSDQAGRYLTIRVQGRLNSGATTADIVLNAPFVNHN
jgi:hypothetical protein